jgi:hypothetical protein
MGEKRNAYRFFVGKPEGERLLGRPRCRWVNKIRIDLVEIEWGGLHWIGMAQDRESGNETSASVKCWETTEWLHNWWSLE